MDVVRLIEGKVLSVMEEVVEFLEGGIDYRSFEGQLKKKLDKLGCELLQTILEALDQKLRVNEDRKQAWRVVRKNDPKEILTPFGSLVYQRSYFRHKDSKRYAYLVDEKVGITPHARVGVSLKGELLEACTGVSYEGATAQLSRYNGELKVSRQTVAASVQGFQVKAALAVEQKRRVPVLYLEADEDHVKIRDRKGAQARLIYLHEGFGEEPRRHLKNVRYFTTVSKDPEQFWMEVCDYIDSYYELESLEAIYLSGDGGGWIRAGQEYIPGVTFILDKFHLARYILSATAHVPELRRLIYQGVRALNKQAVLGHLFEALRRAEGHSRQKRIIDTLRYIENNWDGIEAAVKNSHVGCSAEAHVSHILAARLSSRPMAWSLKGADRMAAMRAVKANGESASEHYLAMQKPAPVIVELKQEVQKQLERLRQRRQLGREDLGNVPLFYGANNFTRLALKKLNECNVV